MVLGDLAHLETRHRLVVLELQTEEMVVEVPVMHPEEPETVVQEVLVS
jgi:hypothetical protein